jgi:hypothetical protein
MKNQTQAVEIARRVALEQAIARKSDEYDRRAVEHAESLLQTDLKNTQVRGLETLAYTTDKVSDVTDWLKVRVGRDSGGKGWAKEGIGREILNWMTSLRSDAEQIVADQLWEKDPELVRQVYLRLIREYLKHLAAHFEYKLAEKKK